MGQTTYLNVWKLLGDAGIESLETTMNDLSNSVVWGVMKIAPVGFSC